MSYTLTRFKRNVGSLAPEVLLEILLNLESHQTVVMRRLSKEFLGIIDSNKSLWRSLEWTQLGEEESPLPALEMFDEKSGSTMKEVSITQPKGKLPKEPLLEVLVRSRSSIRHLSLKFYIDPSFIPDQETELVTELASGLPCLDSMVLWPSYWLKVLPKTRLIRKSKNDSLGAQSTSKLRRLWCWNAVEDWRAKGKVSSLISFADPFDRDPRHVRSFIAHFSTTLVHLSINSDNAVFTPSLSCPSLRILEGRSDYGFPSWLDAPNLRIVIATHSDGSFYRQLPFTVEELWLRSWYTELAGERDLDFLSSVCPRLNILKLGKRFFEEDLDTRTLLESFRAREEKVGQEVEIEGIKMRSLEKLIVPTELLKPDQLAGLREIVKEAIDIEDYPDLIELEY